MTRINVEIAAAGAKAVRVATKHQSNKAESSAANRSADTR